MPDDIHSIRKISPSYVIAAGTQVVLKVSKVVAAAQEPAAQGEAFRKPGTVGVVMQCPPNNDEPYVVQFADGTTAKAYFHELTLRRKEIEMELERLDVDLLPYVIYLPLSGWLEGVRPGGGRRRRRFAGNLSAAGEPALGAAPLAGTA